MRAFAGLSALLALCARPMMAQNFTVPSTWRRPESAVSPAVRIQLAKNAIAPLIQTIQPSNGTNYHLNTWESANLMAVIANNDYLSRTSNYNQVVLNSLSQFGSSHPLWYDTQVPRNVTSDALMWGLANYYTYRAYGASVALSNALAIWNEAYRYYVQFDSTRGQGCLGNGKSGECTMTCNGQSTQGGVFWQASTPTDYEVNGESVGAFMALTAYLCEATLNSTICDAGSLSAAFMRDLMYNGEYIIDTISIDTCVSNTAAWSYNTGFLLEGLAVFLSTAIASGVDESPYVAFLESLVASSVVYPAWTQQSGDTAGVMIEDNNIIPEVNEVKGVYKTIFIRGLHEVMIRSASFNNTGMANFIGSFLTVQYNALMDLATNSAIAPNIYSSLWVGPPIDTMIPWGQIPAIEVLNSVLSVNSSSDPPIPSAGVPYTAASGTFTASPLVGPTAASQSSPSRSSLVPNIIEIILSAIGGVIVLAILFSFFYALYKGGWTGVKNMFKSGWSNRGTVGTTVPASDTGVSDNAQAATTGDAENMREAPVMGVWQVVKPTPAPTPTLADTPEFVQGSSTRPEFVQGSSRMPGIEEVIEEADAHGISIVSR